MRRSGILARRWALFLQLYGDFEVEALLYQEMRAFMTRYGTPAQQAALRGTAVVEIHDLP
jgi:hypothetical protein